ASKPDVGGRPCQNPGAGRNAVATVSTPGATGWKLDPAALCSPEQAEAPSVTAASRTATAAVRHAWRRTKRLGRAEQGYDLAYVSHSPGDRASRGFDCHAEGTLVLRFLRRTRS